jgi:DNA-binding response OmpR family regulator
VSRRILVVEDNREIADLVALHLRDMGYQVDVALDGRTGLREALTGAYQLVILDLMLPGVEGLEICKQLRSKPDYTPILMLTAKSGELDRVLGLEVGADDYLTKPFSIRELLARVKALFRRIDAIASRKPAEDEPSILVGPVEIDIRKRVVTVENRRVDLTAKEFDLLVQFAKHPGRAYSRTELLDSVWGYGHDGYEHTVNTHINRLRAKIEKDPSHPRYVLTVWGVGYKFFDPRNHAQE